jgi:hypothetical protein
MSNTILSTLDIDSTDFFYNRRVNLYKDDHEEPYGKVLCLDGHYHLTVGDLEIFDDDRRLR